MLGVLVALLLGAAFFLARDCTERAPTRTTARCFALRPLAESEWPKLWFD